jgi:hypothetical protein
VACQGLSSLVLVGRSDGRFVDRSVGWLVSWSVGQLVSWSVGQSVSLLVRYNEKCLRTTEISNIMYHSFSFF